MPPSMPSPPLVGRERELTALRERLDAALAGNGSLVLIGGEAGIGKTALADALCQEAVQCGALLLVGRCYDLSETPPYGLWIEVLSRYHRHDGMPPPPDAFAQRGTVGEVPSQVALFQQVLDFLFLVGSHQPLVLLLDDLHWADPASLDLLRLIARAVTGSRLLLLATYRAEAITRHHPLYQLLPLLVREAGAERLDLPRLDNDAVRTLVQAQYALTDRDTGRLVAYLHGRAEGNALFIGELLRALAEGGVLRREGDAWMLGSLDALGVPPLLRQVIDGRIARFGEVAHRLLTVAAVIGQTVPLDVWAAVGEVDRDTVLDLAERAEEAQILAGMRDGNGMTFAHALIREALYEGLSSVRRRRLHREVGDVLIAGPNPDPDAIANHFQRAGDDRALPWLLSAGERAQGTYAWVTAAERFEAALALMERHDAPASERGWLLYRLASLRFYGDPVIGVRVLDAAIRLAEVAADPALAASARFTRGFYRFWDGDFRLGLTDMEAGQAGLDTLSAEDRRRFHFLLASGAVNAAAVPRGTLALHQAHVGRYAEARGMAEAMLAEASDASHSGPRDDIPYSEAFSALGQVYAHLGRPDEARTAFGRSRAALVATEDFAQVGLAAYRELVWVVLPYYADDRAAREQLVGEAEEAWARAAGAQPKVPVRLMRLPLLFLEGNWHAVRQVGDAALFARWHNLTVPVMGELAYAQGDAERAWALVRTTLPEGAASVPGTTMFRNALAMQRLAAMLALAEGDLPTAQAWLTANRSWLEASGAVMDRAEGHLAWAALHRAEGDTAAACRSAQEAMTGAQNPHQPLALLAARRLLGVLESDRKRFTEAKTHVAAALALAAACNAPYERALTLVAYATIHAEAGATAAAGERVEEARTVFAALGAQRALADAKRLAVRLSGEKLPAYPAGLTAREVEILRLVAAGHTSRIIAERLFLSVATVNNHVSHILTKTDTATRAEAVAFAQRHGIV